MKILVVGAGHSAIHEVAMVAALKQMGHQVEAFYWHAYFQEKNNYKQIWIKAQNKFIFGSAVRRLNRDLIAAAKEFDPGLIFVYRGTHILDRSLLQLKQLLPRCEIFGYNNDDPCAPGHPPWLWRNFMRCVPLYDVLFAYREHNIHDYRKFGAKKVGLLMPWFVPNEVSAHRTDTKAVVYDVVFVGHYENDKRVTCLEKIAKSDYAFGLFGPDWNRAPRREWMIKYQPVLPVVGEDYWKTLNSAKIALCFFSELNRDTYTRRCFEIPAMGVFMLCQYSDDMAKMFEDGVDVAFFRDSEEMMEKIKYYIIHDNVRAKIAASGRMRVVQDKHDIFSRMDYVLNFAGQK